MKKIILIITIAIIARMSARIDFCTGYCVDNSGAGETDDGFYIYYDPERFSVGDRVYSTAILNPLNNYCDDVLVLINISKNSIEIR